MTQIVWTAGKVLKKNLRNKWSSQEAGIYPSFFDMLNKMFERFNTVQDSFKGNF